MVSRLKYFDQWPNRRYISPTMAQCVLQCPWQYWARYIAKVDKEDGLALRRGSFFDSLVEGDNCTVGLSGQDVQTILQRYEEYEPRIPQGITQHPIQFRLGYKDWWVRGFIDILPDDPDAPFVEVKYATKPWQRRKLAYNRMQVMTYSFALDWRPGVFHVKNHETPEFQMFDERDYTGGKDKVEAWKAVAKDYVKACKMIEAKTWDAKPQKQILCEGEQPLWGCDYYDVCPKYREKSMKEARIDELVKCF